MKEKRNWMDKARCRRRAALGLCLILLLGIVPLPDGVLKDVVESTVGVTQIRAEAATGGGIGTSTGENDYFSNDLTYSFSDGEKRIWFRSDGKTEYDFGVENDLATNEKREEKRLTLEAWKDGNPYPLGDKVHLEISEKYQDSSNSVAYAREVLNSDGTKAKMFYLVPNAPGSTQMMVDVVFLDGRFTIPFIVNVDLDIVRSTNTEPDGAGDGTGFFQLESDDLQRAYSFRFQYPGEQYQVHLKYFDVVSGSASDVKKYDYSKASLSWDAQVGKDTDNRNVITIGADGVMTAVGAGMATMTVKTVPVDVNKVQEESLKVFVPLRVSATPPAIDAADAAGKYINFIKREELDVETGVTGEFTIYSTAYDPAKDVEWTIGDAKTGRDVSDWFQITAESMEDNALLGASKIKIKGAKAGEYVLKARAKSIDSKFNDRFASTIKVTIPVNYNTDPVWMNVGDRYNLYNNTNIPSADSFSYKSANDKIATVNEKGVITAKNKGATTVYAYDKSLYGNWEAAQNDGKVIACAVHVVDTLSLSTGDATIMVGGSLNLTAQTSNTSSEITWSVGDASIVSIEAEGGVDALITGLKAGETVVTASQTIGGVEKTVSCTVTVVAGITKVEVSPKELEIDIGEYATLSATVTPKLSAGVRLYWKSSDESILKVENPDNRSTTCTVVGVSPGTAVVMAINQENVVVGSCKITVLRAPDSISLSETSVTVAKSAGRYQLYATVTPTTATNQNITWKSSNTKIATVDANGLVTFTGHGTVTIIAASEAKPELIAMCEMKVAEPVSSVVLDQTNISLDVGATYRLTYEVLPTTAYDRSVTFTSMDTKVAVVDATGLVTAKKAGTTYVTITTTDGKLSKVCTVKVRQAATTIKLDAAGLMLDVGESYTLQVIFNPKTTTETTLRWSTNDKSVAKVDTKGCVTAVGSGECIIAVTTSNNLTAFCYVTVNQQVTGIELNYESVSVNMGRFVELEATVLPDDASNQDVKWKSSNTEVATVSDNGTVKGVQGGSAIITCTTDEGDYSAVCMVTVIEKATSIKLNKTSYKLGLGKKFTLTAEILNPTTTDQSVTWVSSNPEICTVNKRGMITGIRLGRVTVTAYANDDSEVEASCEVWVVRQATSITVNRGLLNMVVGDNATLTATIKPDNATYKKAGFSSSDTNVAIVDTDGRITAVGAGTCNITARPKDNSGLKAVCVVIVRPVVAATAITLNPSEVTMGIGGSESVGYSLRPVDSTDGVTWTSNNKAVATVGRTSGIIRAVAPGTAVVTATTSSGRSGTVRVTVVGLNYERLALEQYDSYQLRVMGATNGVIWDVDNPDICTVAGGRVTAKKAGTTTVVARVNGAELRCRVTVTDIAR